MTIAVKASLLHIVFAIGEQVRDLAVRECPAQLLIARYFVRIGSRPSSMSLRVVLLNLRPSLAVFVASTGVLTVSVTVQAVLLAHSAERSPFAEIRAPDSIHVTDQAHTSAELSVTVLRYRGLIGSLFALRSQGQSISFFLALLAHEAVEVDGRQSSPAALTLLRLAGCGTLLHNDE